MYLLFAAIALLVCLVAYLLPDAMKTKKLRKNLSLAEELFHKQKERISSMQTRLEKGQKGYESLSQKWEKISNDTELKNRKIELLTSSNQKQSAEIDLLRSQSVEQITKLQQSQKKLEEEIAQEKLLLEEFKKSAQESADKRSKESLKAKKTAITIDKAQKEAAEKLKRAVNPEEFLKLKRKCRDYARLLKGTKGLRDLSDARADNMQTAALQLAKHLHGNPKELESIAEGQIIASALEKVGGTFFVETEDTPS